MKAIKIEITISLSNSHEIFIGINIAQLKTKIIRRAICSVKYP
jgi:hypothetical protein